jgi:hypothetical protein
MINRIDDIIFDFIAKNFFRSALIFFAILLIVFTAGIKMGYLLVYDGLNEEVADYVEKQCGGFFVQEEDDFGWYGDFNLSIDTGGG